MRIDNQPPVYALTNSSANQNVRPNTPEPETVLNTQSMKEQNREIQEKQDYNNEAVKNRLYDSSGLTNRLPGTVSLFDTTA